MDERLNAQDIRKFCSFLDNATDQQLRGIYERERKANRDAYVALVENVARERGVDLS